ncbi:MAG: hypothetical protein CR994_00705 [Maribacter sp.]|nr:MAG: hypothetical protein CR994_00705 [Maribacter sp.]
MNKIKITFFILIGIIPFLGCEKDDICVDDGMRLLVIRFYDATDSTKLKNVPNLVVRGLVSPDTLGIIPNAASDSIAVPLRSDFKNTSFVLSQQTTDDSPVNYDVLTFSYETKEAFISRACGFIPNYENLNPSLTTDTDNWIKGIETVNPSIENSDTAHVKIFH